MYISCRYAATLQVQDVGINKRTHINKDSYRRQYNDILLTMGVRVYIRITCSNMDILGVPLSNVLRSILEIIQVKNIKMLLKLIRMDKLHYLLLILSPVACQ